jgi:hypothetical protein
MKKALLGGLLGGLVLFVWGFVSHALLPLGEVGFQPINPDKEPALLTALKAPLPEKAVYIFPSHRMGSQLSAEEQAAWEKKYEAGPYGIIVYTPTPGRFNMGKNLGIEFLGSAVAAGLAGLLMLSLPAGYWQRVMAAGLVGLIMGLDVDLSHWNWYGFPTPYVVAQIADHTLGWLMAGLVLAKVCRPDA